MLFKFKIKEELKGDPLQYINVPVYADESKNNEETIVTTEKPKRHLAGHIVRVLENGEVLVSVTIPIYSDSEIPSSAAIHKFMRW